MNVISEHHHPPLLPLAEIDDSFSWGFTGCIVNCGCIMGKYKQLPQKKLSNIVCLHNAGLQTQDIVQQLGVSGRSVRRYVARYYQEGGIKSPTQKPRSGRPRKASERAVNIIKRQLETNPRLTARKVKETNPEVFGEIAVRTVSKYIHDQDYKSRRPVKKPLLTKVQQGRRVTFAKKYLAWPDNKWLDVLWSNEATFSVTCNNGVRVYRRSGSDPLDPRYVHGTLKHPDSLMVWGSFSGRGLGTLVVLPRNIRVNQHVYYELLNDHLSDAFERTGAQIFQQDGAPAHTAKSVIQWLNDCEVEFIRDWSGNSPDISPIENLWRLIKKKLEEKDVSSVPKLEAAIREAWDNLSLPTLRKLALSVPRRLQSVKKRKGLPTKY